MEDQVLSIEQMKELEILGIDISKASMFWEIYKDGTKALFTSDLDAFSKSCLHIPTFTLQDIIDLIVSWAEYDFCVAHNKAFLFDLSDSDTTIPFHMEVGKTTIEAAFKLLKWLKQNNYI